MKNELRKNIFSLNFLSLVLTTSLMSLILQLNSLNLPSIAVSIIGVLAFVCFMKQSTVYRLLCYVWVIAQLVTIEIKKIITDLIFVYDSTVFDATQTYFKTSFGGEYYLSDDKMLAININVIAVILFILFRKNESLLLHGRLIQLEITYEDTLNTTYLIGTTQKKLFNRMGKKWSWVKLQTPLIVSGNSYSEVFIANKKRALLSPFSESQPVYLKLPKTSITSSMNPEVIESLDLLQNEDIDCEAKFLLD